MNPNLLSEISLRLFSGNNTDVVATVKELRNEGSPAIIPILADLLLKTTDRLIVAEIQNLLDDIKEKSAIPVIIELISNSKYRPIYRNLVQSCWESGLDYSSNIRLFVQLAVKEDYITAIEALTVVENITGEIPLVELEMLINETKRDAINAIDEKKVLLTELIYVLENMRPKKV